MTNPLPEEGPSTEEITLTEADDHTQEEIISPMEDTPAVTVTVNTTANDLPSTTTQQFLPASGGTQPSNHSELTDYELLKAVTGERPLSTRLHLIRDRWIDNILADVKLMEAEAARFIALSRKVPAGSRAWRLLREEADRVETQCNLTRGQLTVMRRAPGPFVQTTDAGNEADDGSLGAAAS